jgi:hypothetical protein
VSYARSKKSVTKVEQVLKQLLEAQEDMVFLSQEPHKLAYAIHEGLKSSAIYPEFQKYAELRDKFTIRIRNGKVLAELKHRAPIPLGVVREQLGKMTLREITSATGIVGAAVANKSTEIYFPDAKLDSSSLSELYQWTEPAGYYIINHGDNGLTLTKIHPGEMNYTPISKVNGNG